MKKIVPIILLAIMALSCNSHEPSKVSDNNIKAVFKANPATFTAEGGKGKIEGALLELDKEGKVVKESAIPDKEFTISLKSGSEDQLTINNESKEFTIKAGEDEASFVIEAKTTTKPYYTQEITLVRKKADTPVKKNPLLYVAEYNIDPTGLAFVTSCAPDVSGFFTFDEAVEKFKEITIDNVKYHLPTFEEWLAIVPWSRRQSPDYVDFDETGDFPNMEEDVVIAGEKVTSLNDYKALGDNVSCALRFKGTEWLSAWKYEYTQFDNYPVMTITSRLLGENDKSLTIDQICEPAFWENNKEKDVVRHFPASGFGLDLPTRSDAPFAFFWSATSPNDPNFAFGMYFDASCAGMYNGHRISGRSVRLFRSSK